MMMCESSSQVETIVLAVMPKHHEAGYEEPQHHLWQWVAMRYVSRYTWNILHNDPMRGRGHTLNPSHLGSICDGNKSNF